MPRPVEHDRFRQAVSRVVASVSKGHSPREPMSTVERLEEAEWRSRFGATVKEFRSLHRGLTKLMMATQDSVYLPPAAAPGARLPRLMKNLLLANVNAIAVNPRIVIDTKESKDHEQAELHIEFHDRKRSPWSFDVFLYTRTKQLRFYQSHIGNQKIADAEEAFLHDLQAKDRNSDYPYHTLRAADSFIRYAKSLAVAQAQRFLKQRAEDSRA